MMQHTSPFSRTFPAVRRRCYATTTRATSGSSATSSASRSRPRFSSKGLLFPVLLVSAVSSLAINLRDARDSFQQLQSSHQAQLSVLQDLLIRLEQGDRVALEEVRKDFERVGIVQRKPEEQQKEKIGWREILFGRKRTEAELQRETQEMQDIEAAMMRAETGQAAQTPSTNSSADVQEGVSNARPAFPARLTEVSSQTPATSTRQGYKSIFI